MNDIKIKKRGPNVQGTVKPIKRAIPHTRPSTMSKPGISAEEAKRRLENMKGAPHVMGEMKKFREMKRRYKRIARSSSNGGS